MTFLSEGDLRLLKFLWRWKLATIPLLQRLIFPEKSLWHVYRKVKGLMEEGFILEEPPSAVVPVFLCSLTKKGFDRFRRDYDNLEKMRFRPQSVPHDYLATAFHLGDFVTETPSGIEFFTEQEISTYDVSQYPQWVPPTTDHIPDGLSLLHGKNQDHIFAIEVEITPKPIIRYDKMMLYFHLHKEVSQVFWLCGSMAVAKLILARMASSRMPYLDPHNFILIEDFRKLGWGSEVKLGPDSGKIVRDIYRATMLQPLCNAPATSALQEPLKYLFPSGRSPRKYKEIFGTQKSANS